MDYEQILKRFPFLSIIRSNDKEYLGIIQQCDSTYVMFFDYNSIKNPQLKKAFISLGETWWWESNRKIPITFFLYNDMKEFYPFLMVLSAKNTTIDRGHEINLFNISEKRTKRRTIELVKKQ